MKNIFIRNDTELADEICLKMTQKVVGMGKISGNGDCYCYATAFDVNGEKYVVGCNKTKTGFSFSINRRSQ